VLEIWLFGRVRVRVDGGPITTIKLERAQRVLAWLAVESLGADGERRLVPRRAAVQALWAGSGAARPENSLAQALRELRAALGASYADVVVEDGDQIGLAAHAWTDLAQFRRLATTAPGEALRMSERPLLEFVYRSGSHWDHALRDDVERVREELRARVSDTPPASASAAEPPQRRRPSRLLRRVAVVGLLVVLTALGPSLLGLADRGTDNTARGVEPCRPGYTAPDPADARVATAPTTHRTPRPAGEVLVGIRPVTVAVGREGIWVGEQRGLTLVEPHGEPERRPVIAVADRVTSSTGVFDIALARDMVWVTRRDGMLVSIDRATRRTVGAPIRYGSGAGDLVLAAGSIWINNFKDDYEGSVTRVDPCTRRVVARIAVGRSAAAVSAGFGSVWVSDPIDKTVERFDARNGRRLASVGRIVDPEDIARVGDELWVVRYGDQTLVRIDPTTNRLVGRPIAIGPDPAGIAVAPDAVWIPLYGDGSLTRIDRRRLTSRRAIVATGNAPTDAAAGFGRIWTPDDNGDSVALTEP
jgi:streptogramin lyase